MLPEHYYMIAAFCTSDDPEEYVSGHAAIVQEKDGLIVPIGTMLINSEEKPMNYFLSSGPEGMQIGSRPIANVTAIELVKHSAKGKCHLSIDTKQR